MNSDNVHELPTALAEAYRQLENLPKGGGGGTYDGMEARVARLETKMDKVEERLTSIEVLLARIDAKLDSKIDYKWLTVYVLGIIAVIMRNEISTWLGSIGSP